MDLRVAQRKLHANVWVWGSGLDSDEEEKVADGEEN